MAEAVDVPQRRPNPDLSNLVYMGGQKRTPPRPAVGKCISSGLRSGGGDPPAFSAVANLWLRWGRPLVFYGCGLFIGWLVWGAHG